MEEMSKLPLFWGNFKGKFSIICLAEQGADAPLQWSLPRDWHDGLRTECHGSRPLLHVCSGGVAEELLVALTGAAKCRFQCFISSTFYIEEMLVRVNAARH